MRAEIAKLHKQLGTTFVYVTHDQTEAMTMGTRIVVMRDGVVQQISPPQELFDKPCNLFVATFIGTPQMNIIRARLEERDGAVAVTFGEEGETVRIPLPESKAALPAVREQIGKEVLLGVRPNDVYPAEDGFPCRVEMSENQGAERNFYLRTGGADIMTQVSNRDYPTVPETMRANMDIQGNFFSPWEDDARGYGGNVRAFFLNMRKPASEQQGYAALRQYAGQNGAGVKARERLIAQGFDGVNNSGEEYIVFDPQNIKSATDNIGTFDANSPDIRFSRAKGAASGRKKAALYSALARQIEGQPEGAVPGKTWLERLKSWVNKGLVKEDEVFWSGVREWLGVQDGKIARDAVQEFLSGGLGVFREPAREDYAAYSFAEEGENYRELVLKVNAAGMEERNARIRALEKVRDQKIRDAQEGLNKRYIALRKARNAKTQPLHDERREKRQPLLDARDAERAPLYRLRDEWQRDPHLLMQTLEKERDELLRPLQQELEKKKRALIEERQEALQPLKDEREAMLAPLKKARADKSRPLWQERDEKVRALERERDEKLQARGDEPTIANTPIGELAERSKAYWDDFHRIRADYGQRILAVNAEYRPRIDAINAEFEPDIAAIRDEYQPRIDAINAEYNERTASNDIQKRIDAINAEYQPRIDAFYSKDGRSFVNDEVNQRIRAVNAKYDPRIDALDAEYQARIDAINAEYRPRLDAIDAKREQRIRDIRAEYEQRVGAEYEKAQPGDGRFYKTPARDYKSSHWENIKNPIAHLRLTDFDGGQTLFVEELQSDWAQEKRAGKDVPDAPFIGSTSKWLDLLLKNVLVEAANGSYSRVAFVTGAQSSERYSMHTHVKSLTYDGKTLRAQPKRGGQELVREAAPEQLEGLVGKEMAKRLLAAQTEQGTATLTGDDLRVTAVGMHDFYDNIVPRALEKLLRKLDPQVRLERVYQEETGAEQWSFEVTPAMRAKLAEGLPLFRRNTATTSASSPASEAGIESDTAAKPLTAKQRSTVNRVKLMAASIQKVWQNAPRIEVVWDAQSEGVPDDVRAQDALMRSNGAEGTPEAVYVPEQLREDGTIEPPKVIVFASQTNTVRDMVRVVAHEVLGHHGLRGAFGRGMARVLNELMIARRAEVVQQAREYGLLDVDKLPAGVDAESATDAQVWAAMSEHDRQQAAEEVLAHLAETYPQLPLVRRAIAAIRTWLRQHVPGFDRMGVSDDEIVRSFILPAREWVQRGMGVGTAPGTPLFRRAWHGGSAGIEREGFKLQKIGTGEGAQAFGWGMYFASQQRIADWYRKQYKIDHPERDAALYALEIPEDEDLLAWDAPLSESSVAVQRGVQQALQLHGTNIADLARALYPDGKGSAMGLVTGKDVYNALA
ncbi:MAG: hypothetical protein J6T92_03135, partial [Ottowia sp.]|nr:hypothetical protein [Ottowia sp.]